MTDHHWNLQQAVYAVLTEAGVADGRVYDDVPAKPAFPYVQIGETQPIPDDVSPDDEGFVETITLHVWSRKRGQKEIKQILSAIYDALHQVALTVTGRASALAWVRHMRIIRDPDGITRHGILDVEIIHRN